MRVTKWSVSLKGAREVSQRPPVVVCDCVLLTFNHGSGSTFHGTLLCVEASSGREVWRFEGDHFLNQPVIDASHSIFVSSFSGALYKLDIQGTLQWKAAPSSRNCWKAIECGNVIAYPEIAGRAKDTWGLSKEDGSLIWVFEHGGHSYSLATDSEVIVGSSMNGGMTHTNAILYCIAGATGRPIWKTSYPKYLFRPTISDKYVFVGSRGCVLCLSLLNGAILADYQLPESVTVSQPPLVTPRGIVFCAEDGTVLSLSLVARRRGGFAEAAYALEPNWIANTEGNIEAAPVLSDGHIHMISESGKLLTLSANSGDIVATVPIPKFKRGFGLTVLGADFIIAASREAIRIGQKI